jgi:hypothetical protein
MMTSRRTARLNQPLTLTTRIAAVVQAMVNVVCDKVSRLELPNGEPLIMSDAATSRPKRKKARNGSEDKAVLAHVEQWMALIREIAESGQKA